MNDESFPKSDRDSDSGSRPAGSPSPLPLCYAVLFELSAFQVPIFQKNIRQ